MDVSEMNQIVLTNSTFEDLLQQIQQIIKEENQTKIYNFINIKDLSLQLKIQLFKYFLTNDNIQNPIIILNIINMIKIFNTMDQSFFSNKYIYIKDIEEFLDLKLDLNTEIKAFNKKLSIFFLSLFKSYNKLTFSALDKKQELPPLFKIIFCSEDLLTLSGIFSITQSFNTDQLVYIENAYAYIQPMLQKNKIYSNIIQNFFKGLQQCQKDK